MCTIVLDFWGEEDPQLIKTQYFAAPNVMPIVAVRGKTAGAFQGAGTFQWTSAVQAICVLVMRTLAKRSGTPCQAVLQGAERSLAASLDYALAKQTNWLYDMFGADSRGNISARRLFIRTNPERKMPGPVYVKINDNVLDPANIVVFVNGKRIESSAQFADLLSSLERYSDPDWKRGGPVDGGTERERVVA